MKNATLEILLHAPDAGRLEYSLSDAQGVHLAKAEPLPNPNYAILHLRVSAAAPSHTFTINARGRRTNIRHRYTLMPRSNHRRGLDLSDIIYLITPDRFANGNPANDNAPGMKQPRAERNEPYGRHGGDIQGIIDRLDYIQSLGMTALWPNPLLENDQPHESYHGYAFTDFYKIDPRFGSNALYKTLADELHRRNMKLIQDVVYNHIGNEHYLYRDMPDPAWFNLHPTFTQTNYRDPVLYDPYASHHDLRIMTDGWFDKHMPDLNQRNPRVARYLIQQTLWWVQAFDIDALRIDTYAYPDQDFMRQWGKAVKEQYPDLFLFAETWVHGHPSQAWFLGDALGPEANYIDGLTDFQVHYAINDALTQEQGWTEGVSRLYNTLAADYIYKNPQYMVTFVDNHDLARFHGVVNQKLEKFSQGILLLFTLRGIPSLYYGTEILMSATDGHGLIREDFPGGWPGDRVNKFDRRGRSPEENEAWDLIATLAEMRRNTPALYQGKLTHYVPKDGVYVYFRYDEHDCFLVAINTSSAKQVQPLAKFRQFIPEGIETQAMLGTTYIQGDNLVLPPLGWGLLRVVR